MAPPTGRPRTHASATGRGTQEDILAAAARVFSEVGYGGASTHRIAREARISQPTLYHYFAGKADILLELLLATVRPSVTFATRQSATDEPPAAQLAALCIYDVSLLLTNEHNIGSLYLLPEISEAQFSDFRAERALLYGRYRELTAALLDTDTEAAHGRASLVFGLVESVILRRRVEPALGSPGTAARVASDVADAALAILGLTEEQRRSAVARALTLTDGAGEEPASS